METLELHDKKPRVLFVVKKRINYGNSYGLINSAQFIVNFLEDAGFRAKLVIAEDANDIDCLVTNHNPTHVIIEALWVTPNKFQELFNIPRHRKRKWVVRIHSFWPFLAMEGMAMEWLRGYQELNAPQLTVAPNVDAMSVDLHWILDLKTIHLPNVYCPEPYPQQDLPPKDDTVVNIGCFGSIRPMKNTLAQAVAAIKWADYESLHCRFHVNASRVEQGGDNVIKNLRSLFAAQYHHELIEHDWLSHYDFVQLVKQMDIGLQVSMTETFNIVAADFAANSIPLVGSKEIPFLPRMFQADPTSTENIMNKLEFAWCFPGSALHWTTKMGLSKFNRKSKKMWLKYLKS